METTGRVAEPGTARAHDEADLWVVAVAGGAAHQAACSSRASFSRTAIRTNVERSMTPRTRSSRSSSGSGRSKLMGLPQPSRRPVEGGFGVRCLRRMSCMRI